MMAPDGDALEWLQTMAQFSALTDCHLRFAQAARELEQLRAEVAILRETALILARAT